MINTALDFLTKEINGFLELKNGVPGDKIILSNVAKQNGDWAIPQNTLGISLINIEEERIYKEQRTAFINEQGNTEHMNPDIKLNLYVLITAHFTDDDGTTQRYKEGLKQLSYVISLFQSRSVFTNESSPLLYSLDPNIKKLVVELYSYSFEQQYNFWTVVGAKYLPSVLYRVRLLRYQEKSALGQHPPISSISIQGSTTL
jgi:hypothetical protein